MCTTLQLPFEENVGNSRYSNNLGAVCSVEGLDNYSLVYSVEGLDMIDCTN